MPLVETKIENFVGAICLDYFEKRNALCGTLAAEIIDALDSFAEQRIRAVVLRAKPGVKI